MTLAPGYAVWIFLTVELTLSLLEEETVTEAPDSMEASATE